MQACAFNNDYDDHGINDYHINYHYDYGSSFHPLVCVGMGKFW